jgi:predicted alpha/beta hydrolase family esterase
MALPDPGLRGGQLMTVQILFVQGAGADVHDEWDDKLVESLQRELGAGYVVRYPRMPDEADARYPAWKAALLNEFESLEDGAILVGHSVGGAVLLHVLADERVRLKPGAIVLIAAPFIGEGGWRSDDIEAGTAFAGRLSHGVPVLLYHGTDDDIVPFEHVRLYANAIPQASVRPLPGRDHQLGNDLSEVAREIRSLSAGNRAVPEAPSDAEPAD